MSLLILKEAHVIKKKKKEWGYPSWVSYCMYYNNGYCKKAFGPSPSVIHISRDFPNVLPSVFCELNALSFRFALASHFFWGLWSMIQAKISTIEFGYMVSYCKKAIKSLCVQLTYSSCWVIHLYTVQLLGKTIILSTEIRYVKIRPLQYLRCLTTLWTLHKYLWAGA